MGGNRAKFDSRGEMIVRKKGIIALVVATQAVAAFLFVSTQLMADRQRKPKPRSKWFPTIRLNIRPPRNLFLTVTRLTWRWDWSARIATRIPIRAG